MHVHIVVEYDDKEARIIRVGKAFESLDDAFVEKERIEKIHKPDYHVSIMTREVVNHD